MDDDDDDDALFKQEGTLKLLGPSEDGENATFFLAVASSISSREVYHVLCFGCFYRMTQVLPAIPPCKLAKA